MQIVQLDHKKAYDLINHCTLANKVLSLHIPRGIARWVIDFLMDRSQTLIILTIVSQSGDLHHLASPWHQAGSLVIHSSDQ